MSRGGHGLAFIKHTDINYILYELYEKAGNNRYLGVSHYKNVRFNKHRNLDRGQSLGSKQQGGNCQPGGRADPKPTYQIHCETEKN